MRGAITFPRLIFSAASLLLVAGLLHVAYRSLQYALPPTPPPLVLPGLTEVEKVSQANRLFTFPYPTPDYIDYLKPKPSYSGPAISPLCFDVWDGLPLDYSINNRKYIWANTIFLLDGKIVDVIPTIQADYLVLRISEVNPAYNGGGPLETCYNVELGQGIHLASLQIKAMSGKTFSYSWAFRID